MNVSLHETCVSGEIMYRGRLLEVHCDTVRLSDGTTSTREYVKHPGAVVILALLDNDNLLFERQFRYPIGEVMLELPAGKKDTGEPPLLTAQRELLEETGYSASQWRRLGDLCPNVGYSNERIDIYLAEGLRREGKPQLDAGEFLEVCELSPVQAHQAVLDGNITDSKTVSALYWLYELPNLRTTT